MSLKPINLNTLEDKIENIYEAIVVISKRAQQINEEQKIEFNQRLELVQSKIMSEEVDETEPMETITNPDQLKIASEFEKRVKPPTAAIDELLSDKLVFRYKEETDEQ